MSWHPEIMRRFAEIVSAAETLTVLEFGACDGRDTRELATVLGDSGKPFRFFAFEPDPRRRKEFEQQTQGLQVELVQAAIGSEVGSAQFWLSSGGSYIGSSSLHRPMLATQHDGITFTESEAFTVTLDTFAKAHAIDRVDFIWSDIQGAEADMIAGGRETLKRTRWLYTEADGDGQYEGDVNEAEICALLPGWGNCGRVDGNLLLRNGEA